LASLEALYTHIKLTHKVPRSKIDLKLHKEKKCEFCERVLDSPKDYISHLVNDHPDEEPPKEMRKLRGLLRCECGDKYKAPQDFYRHLKYNHEKIVNEKYQFKNHNEGV